MIGSGFAVDGISVPYGELEALTGTLTGRLESGDIADNVFRQGADSGDYTGTIILERVPEPSQLLLCAGALATLALVRRRGSEQPGTPKSSRGGHWRPRS